jgi:hypothetical protein
MKIPRRVPRRRPLLDGRQSAANEMFAMSYLAVSAVQAAGIVPITLPPPKGLRGAPPRGYCVGKGSLVGRAVHLQRDALHDHRDGRLVEALPSWRDGSCRQGHHPGVTIDDEPTPPQPHGHSRCRRVQSAPPNHSPRTDREDRRTRLLGYAAPAVGMSQRAPARICANRSRQALVAGGARRAGT